MEPEQTKSKRSVIEPLAVTTPKTSDDDRVDIPGKRDHQLYILLFSYHPHGFGQWKEIGRPDTRTYEIGGRGFHPRTNPNL